MSVPKLATSATHHFVRFYEDETLLLDEVAEFIDRAVRAEGTGIVIATPGHVAQFKKTAAIYAASASGNQNNTKSIVILDAADTLSKLLVNNWPDADRFRAVVGRVIADATAKRAGPVHAFGEMVALLAAEGRFDAAIHLEGLWNELADDYQFQLFCAYPASLFANPDQTIAFQHICDSHCKSVDAQLSKAAGSVRFMADCREHRAEALEAEIRRRRRAETILRRKEKELAEFIENAAEAIHRVSGDGIILWANSAELQMLGYTREEYIGHHIADFHVDADVIGTILTSLGGGATLRDQPARLRCKDGSIKHVLIHSNGYFEEGRLQYTRCFTRDATDRIALQLAQEQLRDTLLMAPVPTALLVGSSFTLRLANRRFCDLIAQDDCIGKTFAEILPQWCGEILASSLNQVFYDHAGQVIHEYCIVDFIGKVPVERFFNIHIEPLTTNHAENGLIISIVEVTEQIKARAKIQQSAKEREQLVEELEQASRAKDEFLAMLSHELRNPLAPIVTALQLMSMRGDTGTAHEQEIIQRQVDNLVQLISDLLDMSKVTRGMIELKRESIALVDVLTRAIEMASPILEQRSHRLTVRSIDKLRIYADPLRLAQVLSNLLVNAARYTAAGGDIVLSAQLAESNTLILSVKDSGIGIDAEKLPNIFDLFFQCDRDRSGNGTGLGIGLALVKNFAALHGGSVSAHSAGIGCGSEFKVRIPIGQTTLIETAEDRPQEPVSTPESRRILLVDDNVDAAETLKRFLALKGHEVHMAVSPDNAIKEATAFAPDVAILDIGLPVMDGYTLATHLQKLPKLAHCRYIAVTGYGQEVDVARSEAAGFHKHFLKPVDPQALLLCIQQQPANLTASSAV